MTLAEFEQILNKLPEKTKEINLFHRGEPLVNKDLVSFIIEAKKRGKFVRVYTNGTLLEHNSGIDEFLEAAPDMVAFSVPHPLSAVEVSKELFNKALKNLEKLLELKREKRLEKPYLKLEILSLDKEKDKKAKETLKKDFKLSTIDKIAFRKAHNWGGNLSEHHHNSYQKKPNQCTFPWYALVILADGRVVPCPQDFFGRLNLGNIFEENFETIWNGEKIKELRKLHRRRNISQDCICRTCDRVYRKTFFKVPLEYLRVFWER